MKYLKTYKQLNEGLRDKMSPKSDDEILDYLSTLNPIVRYSTIKKNNIDNKFLPSDEEILDYFKSATKGEKKDMLLKLVAQDNIELVKKILELGVELNLNHYYDEGFSKDAFTLLHIAIDNESKEMVKLLIRYGANPHIKDSNDISSMELAKTYNIDIISMILDKNVNEGLRDKMSGINEDIFHLIDKYPNYFNNLYVSKIADKLGYKFKTTLDSGNSGVAYILDNNKVLKITTDKTEFLVANKLKGKNLKRISNIFETYKIKEQDVYIIVLEYLDSLTEELFELVEEYNGTNIKKKDSPKFNWLKEQLKEIELELKNNGISDPIDFDWWMNMGLKNGNLAVFDVGDKTIDYNNYPELDISNLSNINILKYNVNEGLRDKMIGLSEERIEELLEGLSDNDKVDLIFKHEIDYKYLPRNSKGWCVYTRNLNIRVDNLEQLPEKLIVYGNLNLPFHKVSEYPKDLIVKKNIIFNYNKLTKLPDNLTVNGNLEIIGNNLTRLPKGLTVMGSLYCNNNNLVEIPDDIIVHGDFFVSFNSIKEIPANLYASESLDLCNNKLTSFPSKINIKGMIAVVENEITELPDNLYIRGSLSCSYNKLTKLPKGLVVEKSLYCNSNKITELPDDLIVKEKLYIAVNPLKNIRKPKGVNEIITK